MIAAPTGRQSLACRDAVLAREDAALNCRVAALAAARSSLFREGSKLRFNLDFQTLYRFRFPPSKLFFRETGVELTLRSDII